jgi:hypothetical protein
MTVRPIKLIVRKVGNKYQVSVRSKPKHGRGRSLGVLTLDKTKAGEKKFAEELRKLAGDPTATEGE